MYIPRMYLQISLCNNYLVFREQVRLTLKKIWNVIHVVAEINLTACRVCCG